MKAEVAAFNQEKALVGAFSVIVQPFVEPMEHYTALLGTKQQGNYLPEVGVHYVQIIWVMLWYLARKWVGI